jgi:radical SAM protein (TIGR01212 family)
VFKPFFMDELYNSFSGFLKKKFPGQKILKIPVAAGFPCPNRDGLISQAGCIFCDPFAAGPIRNAHLSVEQQIERYIAVHPGRKYIVYFQSHSNTYGPVSELRRKYEVVFNYENIVGFFIGTRPDMISAPAFLLLEEMRERLYLTVELGLQSIHAKSLSLLKRNHTYSQFLETFQRLQTGKIDTVVHLIIGIPGETRDHMLDTIEEMNRLKPAGIKFHLLHVLKETALHRQYLKKPFPLLSQDEYAELIVFLLQRLDPDIVIHRLTAEREREMFVAPEWALNKQAVLDAIRLKMKKKSAFQGCRYIPPAT